MCRFARQSMLSTKLANRLNQSGLWRVSDMSVPFDVIGTTSATWKRPSAAASSAAAARVERVSRSARSIAHCCVAATCLDASRSSRARATTAGDAGVVLK